jgi:hypothetical protein
VAAISRDSDTTEVRGVGVVGWANWVICAKTDKDSSVSSAADHMHYKPMRELHIVVISPIHRHNINLDPTVGSMSMHLWHVAGSHTTSFPVNREITLLVNISEHSSLTA